MIWSCSTISRNHVRDLNGIRRFFCKLGDGLECDVYCNDASEAVGRFGWDSGASAEHKLSIEVPNHQTLSSKANEP